MWAAVAAPGPVLNPVLHEPPRRHRASRSGCSPPPSRWRRSSTCSPSSSTPGIGRVKPFWIATTLVQRLYGFVPAVGRARGVARRRRRPGHRGDHHRRGRGLVARPPQRLGVVHVGDGLRARGHPGHVLRATRGRAEHGRRGRRHRRHRARRPVRGSRPVPRVLLDLPRRGRGRGGSTSPSRCSSPSARPAAANGASGSAAPRPAFSWRDFSEPVRNRNFLFFTLSIGLWGFSTSVLGPFIAPYITAQDGIGAPNAWLGIMNAITQLADRGHGHRLGHAGRPVRPQAGRAARRPAPPHLDRLLLPDPEQLRVHPARWRPSASACSPRASTAAPSSSC